MQDSNLRPALEFRRAMLKISGEALMGDRGFGLDPPTVDRIAHEIAQVHSLGGEICLVAGGGNIFRGLQGNALAMQSALEARGIDTRVLTAIPMDQICEPYIRRRAMRHLDKGRVCIFAAGTGNPYFTTDTAAVLRASELSCQAVFKGTNVDGVYSGDPKHDADAERYETIGYGEFLQRDLKVMDAAAVALARDNGLPVVVFDLDEPGGLARVVGGMGVYTIIK